MNNMIGLFDSGLGGLSILKTLVKELPNEDYLFYEDSINNPYGEKTEEQLLEITSNIVDYLLDNKCKLIVIACNTATTCCMKKLREKYPNVIFVGTVPAIKVACDNDYKNIILLSTTYTHNSNRVKELIRDYKKDYQQIYNVSGKNLANLIELNKTKEIKELLIELLNEYKNTSDALVLGCTHYSLIKKEIKEVLPNIELIDGCQGVCEEVKRQLSNNNLLNNKQEEGLIKIVNSKNNELIERSIEILNKGE